MFTLPTLCVLLAMGATLYCALRRARLYDKILAVNILGTITVLFIAMYGFLTGRPEFLDIAMLYALLNFVTTIAILKFFEYRDMARGTADQGEI